MTTKTLLSLATVSLLAFAAKAYTVETTNSWFSVDAASVPLDATNWGEDKPTRTASVLNVDTTAAAPVTYTPSEVLPTATRYRVKGNMTVTLNAGVPAVFTVAPKAALVAVAGGTNKWYGWDGDSWEDLSASITTAPVEGTSYDVAIEFFVENSQLKIKYIVGTQSATVTASGSTLPTLTYVGLAGYGSFGDFAALGFEEYEVTIPGENLEAACAAMGIEGDVTADKLNELGENGLTKWESIVLGLPNADTAPYTAPVQTNNGNLGFTIGAAEIGKYNASGANVTVEVYSSSTANGTFTAVQGQTAGGSGNKYTATVEPDSTGVKYYKIKVKITKPAQQ